MTQPTLRPATPADIPAITAIYRPAVLEGTASFELEPPGRGRRCCAASRPSPTPAIPTSSPSSTAALPATPMPMPIARGPAYRFTVENSVYIAPDAQGKGIGRVLLAALIDTCTAQGFRLMVAVIGDSANFASITLHRRAGFTFCGTIHSVGYKFGRWLDSVIMELPLGDGDTSAPNEPLKSAR